jgi:hypothetical protein
MGSLAAAENARAACEGKQSLAATERLGVGLLLGASRNSGWQFHC